eukprot:6484819-Amphidinium_carterae.1
MMHVSPRSLDPGSSAQVVRLRASLNTRVTKPVRQRGWIGEKFATLLRPRHVQLRPHPLESLIRLLLQDGSLRGLDLDTSSIHGMQKRVGGMLLARLEEGDVVNDVWVAEGDGCVAMMLELDIGATPSPAQHQRRK